MKKIFLILTLILAAMVHDPQGSCLAQDHNLEASVLSSGGYNGTSLLHRHVGTLGQPHPIGRGGSSGSVLWSGFWRAHRSLLVSPVPEFAPLTNKLWQNAPNPFNPMTTIKYSITDPAHVQLVVFNVRGQLVRTLVDEQRVPGVYDEVWDGRDDNGGQAASGVYFYRLINGSHQQTEKMLLVK